MTVLVGCSQAPAPQGTPRTTSDSIVGGRGVTTPASLPGGRGGPVVEIPSSSLPVDAVPASSAACARQVLAKGWVAAENARAGTPMPATPPSNLRLTDNNQAMGPWVLGYLDATSAVCGDTLGLHLSGPARTVRIAAYRLGSYHGTGSRLVWRSEPVFVQRQPAAPETPKTFLVEPAWSTTLKVTIGADWPPGAYVLIPEDLTPSLGRSGAVIAAGQMIPLIVRDDAGTEPALYMASTLTWAAYGTWGGRSLYGALGVRNPKERSEARARVVAIHRPLTGSGYQQMQDRDMAVVHWIESLGIDVAYTTDDAVEARPSQVLQHAELVMGGHSEYWTTRMYDTLQAAIGHGVNIAFLGANNVWWHARIENQGRHLAVYRYLQEDPLAATDPQQATVLWSQSPLHRNIVTITGQSHNGINVRAGVQLLRPPAWFTAGTTLHDGSVLPGVVGNEADGFAPQAPRPANLQILAAGVMKGSEGPRLVTLNYVTAPSGAAIFSAGTTEWACELSSRCSNGHTSAATVAAVRQLTRNVILAFATPGAGTRNPAAPILPPDAATLVEGLPKAAIGGYGMAGE